MGLHIELLRRAYREQIGFAARKAGVGWATAADPQLVMLQRPQTEQGMQRLRLFATEIVQPTDASPHCRTDVRQGPPPLHSIGS